MINFSLKFIAGCLTFASARIVLAASPVKLPNGFMPCKLNDPALNDCIKNGLQIATPYLSEGIPSLGLLPTDPLRINTLEVSQGMGAVQLKLLFKDLDILNLNSSVINTLSYDPKKYFIRVSLMVKKPVILESLYEARGKVLILPIVGNGTCKLTLENYKSVTNVQLKPKVKNNDTYLDITNLSLKFTTSKLHMKFNNLFNGEKILGDNMNVFLNENWKELLDEMQPTFESALGTAFVAIIQQFFNKIPINKILLE